jgi:N-methylhydantoinase B
VNDEKIPAKVRMELRKGDVLRFDTPGGGGMGPAAERDLILIERDVANGLVTPAAAARDYLLPPEKVANDE